MTDMNYCEYDENEQDLFDLGDHSDDMDSTYWCDHMGGPDDHQLQKMEDNRIAAYAYLDEEDNYQTKHDDTDEVEYDEPELEAAPYRMNNTDHSNSLPRQAGIIKWLSMSSIIRALRTANGFYVPRGMNVRLADGEVYDALDWLFCEGFEQGVRVSGYSLAYTSPDSPWQEKLTFFLNEDEAPFDPPTTLQTNHQQEEEEDFECVLPF